MTTKYTIEINFSELILFRKRYNNCSYVKDKFLIWDDPCENWIYSFAYKEVYLYGNSSDFIMLHFNNLIC